MSKPPKLTRAERRERRANVPVFGVYGVDVEDAGALTWTGRYMCWASSPQEARARIREAGFHKQATVRMYAPSEPPREGLPDIPAGDGVGTGVETTTVCGRLGSGCHLTIGIRLRALQRSTRRSADQRARGVLVGGSPGTRVSLRMRHDARFATDGADGSGNTLITLGICDFAAGRLVPLWLGRHVLSKRG